MADYVRRNEQGVLVVAASRVALGSVVKCFLDGESAESIHEAYPSLPLESIYGAIAFYLADRRRIDEELARQDEETSHLRDRARQQNLDLRSRLLAAKAAAR